MFCPNCKDEFRSGFTRCGRCNVDLVDELGAPEPHEAGMATPAPPVRTRMAPYCGFFTLEESRQARDRLRRERIRAEIIIREASDSTWDAPIEEEFWLHVESEQFKRAAKLLDDGPAGGGGEDLNCGDCGKSVAAEERFCPHCGARFED